MHRQLIGVAALFFLSVIDSVCADGKGALQKHIQKLNSFPCGMPQPRVIELEEILGEDFIQEKTNGYRERIKPHVTVLYRCSCTGYCDTERQRCVASETENVTLTFGILDTFQDYFEVEAVNHTQCACDTE